MLNVGAMQDQRRRWFDWRQMSASQRFQLLYNATSTPGRSVTEWMKIVLCSTWQSTPVRSI